MLEEMDDIIKTASAEELEQLSIAVLAGLEKMAKDDKDLTQAQIGVREGAKVGMPLGAAGGLLNTYYTGKMLRVPPTPALLASSTLLGTAGGALSGAITGGIHGKIMDRRERKFNEEGKEYNPVDEGKNIGLIGGAITVPPWQLITMPAGWYVGKAIGERYKEQKQASYTELLNAFEKAAAELPADELEVLAQEIMKEAVQVYATQNILKSVKSMADQGAKAAQNAVKAAGNAAKKTGTAAKESANKVKEQMASGNFVTQHPYISTAAGIGVGAAAVPAVQGVQNIMNPARQQPQQQYTMVPVPTNMLQQQ